MRKILTVLVFIFLLSFHGKVSGKRWEADRWMAPAWATHDIAFDSKGNVYMVWSPVCFTRSTDGGANWSPVTWIEGWDYRAGNPDIKVDSKGHIYIAYTAELSGPPAQLYMRKSTDAGASWSEPTRIASTNKGSQWSRLLIDSKDELHIVWQDAPTDPQAPDYSSDCDFYHAASLDGGTTWGSATWIDSSGFYCWGIDATVDQRDNIYVFASYGANRSQLPWQNYCLGSRDSGATWQVTAIGPGNQPFGIVDTDGTLHVAHLNDIGNMQSEIRYNRSFDQGRTFVGEEVLGLVLGQPFPVWLDIVSSQNGKLYVAYQDAASGNFEIHMLTSPNRGKTWLKPERLTYTPTPSLLPTLAFDPSGGLHMIWNEITGNSFSELYYKRAFVPASIK